jgi:hypothetical protein
MRETKHCVFWGFFMSDVAVRFLINFLKGFWGFWWPGFGGLYKAFVGFLGVQKNPRFSG